VEHPSQDSIIVLKTSVDHDDAGKIVGSNVEFVIALFREYLTADEISVDALRSYYVDYYLAQVNNGGFSQFVYNSDWDPFIVTMVRDGMRAMGAKQHCELFEQGAGLVEELGQDRLAAYLASGYFGENRDREALDALTDRFFALESAEDLLALNAAWLRSHPSLCPMETEEQMLQEARRRGEALPDREQRIAQELANEPRYVKLIRALCERAGQKLERVTAGDPTRVHEGSPTLAWHFITDKGHHHMVDCGGKAIMFRGHSTTERVCDLDAPEDSRR